MVDLVVHLEDQADLDIDHLDVGVEEEVIAFDISGTIRDIDDDLLAKLAGGSLTPTEIHFSTTDD